MKKIDENQKITLTIGQLKRLIKETNETQNNVEDGKFNFDELFSEEKMEELDGYDCANILNTVKPKWDAEVQDWLDEEQEVKGKQTDVDDWDIWEVTPRNVIGDDRVFELLYNIIWEWDDVDENGMANVTDIANKWSEELSKAFDDADLDDIEKVGTQTWHGGYSRGGYYPDA